MRRLAEQNEKFKHLHIESCGIGDWHIGQLADERMRNAAKGRGVILSSRAQQFKPSFFDSFDYILAADNEVLNDLHHFARNPDQKAKIHLITAFSGCYRGEEIPDPYYLGEGSFELVWTCSRCREGFLKHLEQKEPR